MKKLLTTLLLLISINQITRAQFTCSTAVPFTYAATATAPQGTTPQLGPDYGCVGASVLRPVWYMLPVCESGSTSLALGFNGMSGNDTVDVVVWGPFTSTANICNQLTAAKISFCMKGFFPAMSVNFLNMQAGEIYIMMVAVSNNITSVGIQPGGGSYFHGSCNLCNNTVSVLEQDVCLLTTDPVTNQVTIVWEENQGSGIASTTIYRGTSVLNQYDSITTIPRSALSEYVDVTANAAAHPWIYKIEVNDSCGNSYQSGVPHTTLHLMSSPGFNNTVNLSWSSYIGFLYNSFYIYRGTSPGSMSLIDSVNVSIHSYTDLAAPAGVVYYQVEVRKPVACSPSRNMGSIYGSALSNISAVQVTTGIDEINNADKIKVIPNPALNFFSIQTDYKDLNQIIIYDLQGRKLKSFSYSNTNEYPITDLSPGVYIVSVEGNDSTVSCKLIKD